jgi:hypothetical protein
MGRWIWWMYAPVEVLNGLTAGGTFGTRLKQGRSQNFVLQVLRSQNGHRFRVNLNGFRHLMVMAMLARCGAIAAG